MTKILILKNNGSIGATDILDTEVYH